MQNARKIQSNLQIKSVKTINWKKISDIHFGVFHQVLGDSKSRRQVVQALEKPPCMPSITDTTLKNS